MLGVPFSRLLFADDYEESCSQFLAAHPGVFCVEGKYALLVEMVPGMPGLGRGGDGEGAAAPGGGGGYGSPGGDGFLDEETVDAGGGGGGGGDLDVNFAGAVTGLWSHLDLEARMHSTSTALVRLWRAGYEATACDIALCLQLEAMTRMGGVVDDMPPAPNTRAGFDELVKNLQVTLNAYYTHPSPIIPKDSIALPLPNMPRYAQPTQSSASSFPLAGGNASLPPSGAEKARKGERKTGKKALRPLSALKPLPKPANADAHQIDMSFGLSPYTKPPQPKSFKRPASADSKLQSTMAWYLAHLDPPRH
jgi:hypothetical protein